jgi:hypothetical protein
MKNVLFKNVVPYQAIVAEETNLLITLDGLCSDLLQTQSLTPNMRNFCIRYRRAFGMVIKTSTDCNWVFQTDDYFVNLVPTSKSLIFIRTSLQAVINQEDSNSSNTRGYVWEDLHEKLFF